MKHFDPEPAPGNFGKRIPGLNLSEPQAPEVFKALFSILYEHRFLVIPGQDLTLDQYLQFGKSFGTPIPHVKNQTRMEGHPEIQAVHNIRKEKKKYTDGAAWWHTDQSYEAQPAITTMLYSVQAPKKGGETRIADMIAAYEALSAEMKTRIVLEGCLEESASPYYAVPTPSRMASIKLGRRNFLRPAKAFGRRYCPDQALNIGPPVLEILLQGATQGRDFTARLVY